MNAEIQEAMDDKRIIFAGLVLLIAWLALLALRGAIPDRIIDQMNEQGQNEVIVSYDSWDWDWNTSIRTGEPVVIVVGGRLGNTLGTIALTFYWHTDRKDDTASRLAGEAEKYITPDTCLRRGQYPGFFIRDYLNYFSYDNRLELVGNRRFGNIDNVVRILRFTLTCLADGTGMSWRDSKYS